MARTRSEGLARVATDSGHFTVLALDHVRSFATTVRPADPDSITMDDIRSSKLALVRGLAAHAGAILIDPGFLVSLDDVERRSLAGTGVILGIEDGDYEEVMTAPRLLPGWDPQRAKHAGADAVKISVYFDPNGDTSPALRFVAEVVEACDQADIPLFCEPLALHDRPEDRAGAVLEGVKLFGPLGADILKLQFPISGSPASPPGEWGETCREMDRLSPVPWTILSEGGDYPLFRRQLRVACEAGASGFMGGRAIWREAAIGLTDMSSATNRLDELSEIAVSVGRPRSRVDHTSST